MPFDFGFPYYLVIALQAICVFHSIRKGNQQKWIWIIVFLPAIGSIAYIFTEVINKRDLSQVTHNMSHLINPQNRIKALEDKLKFSNTFNNRVALADACLAAAQTERAITLYESALQGIFADNEYAIMHLMKAYYEAERFSDLIQIAQKVLRLPDFQKSTAHLLYALALEKTGKMQEAEQQLKSLCGRFSHYENRYQYALFLIRNERFKEAAQLLEEMLEESVHLSSQEKRNNREWFTKASKTLQQLPE